MPSQNSLPIQENSDDDSEIDLLALLGTLLDGKWIIIGITAFFCAMGIAYALLSTPVYLANALVQVEEKKGGMAALGGMAEMTEMFGGTSPAVTEIELLKSRAVLGKAVENLKLDIIVEPNYFPLIGHFLSRHFEPINENDLATPTFGLNSYTWGGEKLDIFQLEVPEAYLGKDLTLRSEGKNTFSLFNENDEVVLTGEVGDRIEQNGFKLQVASLNANPGAQFSVTKLRRLNAILQYQEDVSVTERGKESGIIALSLESEDPALANSVLDEINRLYVLQNVQRNSAEAAQSLELAAAKTECNT